MPVVQGERMLVDRVSVCCGQGERICCGQGQRLSSGHIRCALPNSRSRFF